MPSPAADLLIGEVNDPLKTPVLFLGGVARIAFVCGRAGEVHSIGTQLPTLGIVSDYYLPESRSPSGAGVPQGPCVCLRKQVSRPAYSCLSRKLAAARSHTWFRQPQPNQSLQAEIQDVHIAAM